MKSEKQYRGHMAAIFFACFVISIGLGVFGPRLLGVNTKPSWMLCIEIGFGLVAVATVPFAWRWLYSRSAA